MALQAFLQPGPTLTDKLGLRSGENAATALENNLTTLEGKIDELLASFERASGAFPPAGSANGTGTSGSTGGGGSQNASNK